MTYRNGSNKEAPTASISCRRRWLDGLNDFAELVIPELQRRGLFRMAYEGTTLRQHLGVPNPGWG